jgi:hypothetical protein
VIDRHVVGRSELEFYQLRWAKLGNYLHHHASSCSPMQMRGHNTFSFLYYACILHLFRLVCDYPERRSREDRSKTFSKLLCTCVLAASRSLHKCVTFFFLVSSHNDPSFFFLHSRRQCSSTRNLNLDLTSTRGSSNQPTTDVIHTSS